MTPALVWFRQDLRLADNPALAAGCRRRGPVVPVYILDDAGEGNWPLGGASRWWLHHSLQALDRALRGRGSRLVLARGDSGEVLGDLLRATGAGAIYWNRRCEPAAVARDRKLEAGWAAAGIAAQGFNASLLHEPSTVRNKSGGPFQVFTPFWRHCLSLSVSPPARLPAAPLPAPARWPKGGSLGELGLLPATDWARGLRETWEPGEAGARRRLRRFVAGTIDAYADGRDRPGLDATSGLSPHLHFGEIGPRQVWTAVRERSRQSGVFPVNRGAQAFLKELGWREFAHHLLSHFPDTPEEPLRPEFAAFPWRKDPARLEAWQRGQTGYPIVDAGMRQLWRTGGMHNRVRMIAASFLVKHLRISWREGAAWFWDTLVDADLASNTLGWQWTAGCGADAAPYFRVFNPILQGERFDPDGTYVRRWVPELARLPARFIHRPWEAPAEVLAAAGVTLGRAYPAPLVRHEAARAEALAAFRSLRRSTGK